MLRRIIVLTAFVLSLFASVKTDNLRSVMTGCSIYQIGESEFILKLLGRNLPLPVYEHENTDNSLKLTLNNAKVRNPDAIKSSLEKYLSGIPIIYSFNAENVSADNNFYVSIEIKSDHALKVHSISRSNDGYSIRIKAENSSGEPLFSGIYVPSPKPVTAPVSTLPFRVDQKITLELRDAELRDVLRGLMAHIGRNIIIDTTFPKDVLITMTLVDVRVDEVLNYLLRTYDLACFNSGINTTTFGTREGLYKLSGENILKDFKINFAEPAQVSTVLKTLAALGDNSVTVDERTKIIYVKTNPAKMVEVEDLISRLDIPQKQVMIQASIFEFSDSDGLAVQNALEIAYDDIRLSLGGEKGISINYRNDRSIRGQREAWTARTIVDTFSALEQKGKGKVLANPSVIATDGKQATITLTQDYPYISDRDNQKGTVTWSTEEVGPKLTFTPRVGRDGFVTMKLEISTGDVIGTQSSSTGDTMPITTTRSVNTEVRVRDGMPFVIGGLIREDKNNTLSKIPILGNIPLLGDLFSYRINSLTKTQVVMVITPYILDTK